MDRIGPVTRSSTTVDTFTVVPRNEVVRVSDVVLGRPELPISETEDVFTIEVAGLEWDVAAVRYEPTDASELAVAADG